MKNISIEEQEVGYKFGIDGSYFYADKPIPEPPLPSDPVPGIPEPDPEPKETGVDVPSEKAPVPTHPTPEPVPPKPVPDIVPPSDGAATQPEVVTPASTQ